MFTLTAELRMNLFILLQLAYWFNTEFRHHFACLQELKESDKDTPWHQSRCSLIPLHTPLATKKQEHLKKQPGITVQVVGRHSENMAHLLQMSRV